MTECIAAPLSRKDIRDCARAVRILVGRENEPFFDMVHFLDIDLPKFDPEFSLVIDDKETLGECHGLTYPDRNEIHIREDVYERADNGSGRDRFTMAHELFHLLQHGKENISYARVTPGVEIETYRSPEWQSNAFGGELLMPAELIVGMSVEEIMEKCVVSKSAAEYQLSVAQKSLGYKRKPSA